MLAALAAIRDRAAADHAPIKLRCIHIEHGIRPAAQSRGDAEFVKSLCKKFNVPLRIVSVVPGRIAAAAKKLGIGVEAAARLFRRRIWLRELQRLETKSTNPLRIVTAHTGDDMLETVLMRIIRGSGPCGIAAMPVSRGRLLRPLLSLNRRDVLNYLSDNNISWREDISNNDLHYLRNRIRHKLVPVLDENFPQWRAGLESFAQTQSHVAEFIRDEARNRIKRELSGKDSRQSARAQSLVTDAGYFFAQPVIIREEVLFQGIDRLLSANCSPDLRIRTIKRKNIRSFAEGNVTAVDLGHLHIRKNAQQIIISIMAKETDLPPLPIPHSSFLIPNSLEKGFSLLIKTPGSYNLKGIVLQAGQLSAADRKKGSFLALLPLVVRPCIKDDCIERNGRKISPANLKRPGMLYTAADSLGTAAFIGSDGLLQQRDDSIALSQNAVQVSVNNGVMDVQ